MQLASTAKAQNPCARAKAQFRDLRSIGGASRRAHDIATLDSKAWRSHRVWRILCSYDDSERAIITRAISRTNRSLANRQHRRPETPAPERHGTDPMNDHPYDELLRAEPAPPPELHPLLQYLSDAFALLNDWILQPGENDPNTVQAASRLHLSTTAKGNRIQLHHPDLDNEQPGYAETYERTTDGAAELRHDIGLRAVLRTEARSQWNTWDTEARRPEEIRIALCDAPGYYVQCPLDSDGKPYHVLATLERTPEDEDPDGARTIEVPVNRETERLLQMLTTCVAPLQP